MYDYLQNIRVWHQVARKHLVGLASEGGESGGFPLGQTVAQHSKFCTATKHKFNWAVILKLQSKTHFVHTTSLLSKNLQFKAT